MTPLGLAGVTGQSDLVHALLDWRGDDDGDSTGDDESQSKKPRKAMSTESDDDLFDSPLSMLDAGVAEPGEDPLVIAAARARASPSTRAARCATATSRNSSAASTSAASGGGGGIPARTPRTRLAYVIDHGGNSAGNTISHRCKDEDPREQPNACSLDDWRSAGWAGHHLLVVKRRVSSQC